MGEAVEVVSVHGDVDVYFEIVLRIQIDSLTKFGLLRNTLFVLNSRDAQKTVKRNYRLGSMPIVAGILCQCVSVYFGGPLTISRVFKCKTI